MDTFLLDLYDKDQERRASTSSIATEDSGYSSIFRTVNSVRVYSSKDEYLVAMIEDLAIWIQLNHSVECNINNFFDCLETGVILCKQAQMVQFAGDKFVLDRNNGSHELPGKWSNCCLTLPLQPPRFQCRQKLQTFVSRDNVANFIGWMRVFGFNDSVMFETEDLISRKNIRHVVLALLELARVGGLFGLNVPNLIELEQEIDAEILLELETPAKEEQDVCDCSDNIFTNKEPTKKLPQRKRSAVDSTKSENHFVEETRVKQIIIPKPYFPECDIRSLDEMVRETLLECECKNQFPMTRLSEGKYLFGEKDLLIFVRILRSHVMVRVGGGWDTLNHLLYKYDPCRRDKPDGTHQMAPASTRALKIASDSYPKSNSVSNEHRKSSNSKTIRNTKSTDINEITRRLSNIPSSFNQGRKSCGKVTRRSSLQLPLKPEQTMSLRGRGSKIPILCKNLKVIKEVPIMSRRSSDVVVPNDTRSAPSSRRPSPILTKRLTIWR